MPAGKYEHARDAHDQAANHICIDQCQDDKSRCHRRAERSAQQHVAGRREYEHRNEIEQKTRYGEGQALQQSQGPVQMCAIAWGASGRCGALTLVAAYTVGEVLKRSHRPAHPALSEPFQHQREAEDDQQLPGGVEQAVSRVGVARRFFHPAQQQREMGDGSHCRLDVVRGGTDPLGYLNEHLRPEAVGHDSIHRCVRPGTALFWALCYWPQRVCAR